MEDGFHWQLLFSNKNVHTGVFSLLYGRYFFGLIIFLFLNTLGRDHLFGQCAVINNGYFVTYIDAVKHSLCSYEREECIFRVCSVQNNVVGLNLCCSTSESFLIIRVATA